MQNIMNFKQQSTNKIYIINKYNLLYNFVISINNLYIYIYYNAYNRIKSYRYYIFHLLILT